ncbi:MAG: hypothetical protein IPP51_07985 [Bacteroidetes bacterium]|nr:hypothetical protein [Bacteroidota bacterium]
MFKVQGSKFKVAVWGIDAVVHLGQCLTFKVQGSKFKVAVWDIDTAILYGQSSQLPR